QTNASKINKFLNEKVLNISKGLDDLHFENPNYSKKDVKRLFDEIFGKTKTISKTTPTLIECYKWYIEYFSSNPNPATKKPLSNGTIRSFKTSLKKFE